MNASGDKKVCARCAETINAAAKLCPFCQSRQGRYAGWSRELATGLVPLLFLGLAGAFGVWLLPEETQPDGRSFARHRGELAVVRVTLERARTQPQYWISGFVTNTGGFPWRVRELEARFHDAQGNLFDVYHPGVAEPFVVEPGREHAFHVSLGKIAWTNSATVPQVRVQTATDGHLPPKD